MITIRLNQIFSDIAKIVVHKTAVIEKEEVETPMCHLVERGV